MAIKEIIFSLRSPANEYFFLFMIEKRNEELRMKAQIIIIGDEVLNGSIQDRNIQPLLKWLDQLGFECNQVTITRDREDLLLATMQSAWDQADLVISTGGLGPTKDDITKQVLGKLSQSLLRESKKAQVLVEELYKRRGKLWHKDLNHYNIIPEKVNVFDNPQGFAPGLMYAENGKLFLATPGVPRELNAMIEHTLPDILEKHFPNIDRRQRVVSIRTYGIPEEIIFHELCPNLWESLENFGKVSSLPQIMGVDIHIKLNLQQDFQQTKEEIIQKIIPKQLKEYIWAYDNKSIEEVIIEKAKEKKLKIGMAESCTGGLVAHRLTNISGSSSVFMGSMVTYSNESKIDCLGVNAITIESFGAVSEETATEMASGAQEKLKVDIALSLTGIAGPLGGSDDKPVGTVCIGTSTDSEKSSKRYNFTGNRNLLKERFALAALMKILKIIESF